ncbi:uncharacterized protein EV422DRAFT_254684 [Fimicolochytrium jonesii]|uniref:uncharacterized protein n=1 Tax=Fimicolochytrium jonesii TaxID=1396493 RepID=UPI0022FE05C2|nr:uncharacterized protein EV422DRAFT_254684 [Fimicolochytrium jonesii]KAI8825306.1 hypothetical protein EV422DRAFT_254684 [Fimicolochytrium jonesii]
MGGERRRQAGTRVGSLLGLFIPTVWWLWWWWWWDAVGTFQRRGLRCRSSLPSVPSVRLPFATRSPFNYFVITCVLYKD